MFNIFRNKKRPPSDRFLTSDEQSEVKKCIKSAFELLHIEPTEAKLDDIHVKISDFIDSYRTEYASEDSIIETALVIGCLWGQIVCDRLKWQWVYVTIEGNEIFGIISPKREYVIFPMVYIRDLLKSPEADQTSLLLYNMLKAGKLPPSEENKYLVLS